MIPHKQLFKHDPANGVYGDCWRTAVACLLEIPVHSIPHEHKEYADGEQTEIIRGYLQGRGMDLWTSAWDDTGEPDMLDNIFYAMEANNPHAYWMLSGTSRTGCNHVVICKGGKIVHDPSLTDAGIVGPQSNGQYLCEVIIGRGAL